VWFQLFVSVHFCNVKFRLSAKKKKNFGKNPTRKGGRFDRIGMGRHARSCEAFHTTLSMLPKDELPEGTHHYAQIRSISVTTVPADQYR